MRTSNRRPRRLPLNDDRDLDERTGNEDLLDDRYELRELAGVGGVAEVWRAHDRRLRRDVAVKILSGPAARDPSHRIRIEREARALAAISHPNVVGVYDYGEQPAAAGEPVPFVVMELVNGPDLAHHLQTTGPLDPQTVAGLLDGVLAGIAQAHAIGIVHGDLKPANILLAPGGPKVTDFGVARILAEETGTTALTATPTHAAPEVFRGDRPTALSDIYSAACIAYELLTGAPPFRGSSFSDLSRQHLQDVLPSLRDSRSDVPEALEKTIGHGLAKDPRERPQSAAEFAALLRASVFETPPAVVTTAEPPRDPEVSASAAPTVPGVREVTEVLPRPVRPRRWTAALGLVNRIQPGPAIAVLAVLLLVLMHDTATATIRVPDFRGSHLDAASATAAEHGFLVTTVEVDAGGVAGTVVGQRPDPGYLRTRGSTVKFQVTSGAPQVVVPDVAGREVEEARAELEAAGLTVEDVTFRAGSEAAAGTVETTSPAAGESVDQGTPVTIYAAPPSGRGR